MSLMAQSAITTKGITQDQVEAVMRDISYISELSEIGLSEGEVANSFYLPKKTVHEISLTVTDGGAQIVGLDDTVLKQADAILDQQDITLSPFAIQLEENMILAPEYKVADKLVPEMLGFLAAQKDSISWTVLKMKAQALEAVSTTPANFATRVMGVLDTMKANLNTNQGNWVVLISDNIVRKLYTTFNDSGINVGKQIFESLAANNILLKRHTQEDNVILLLERKLCKHYKGDAVALRAPFTRNQESITASTVYEFYFTSDYFTKPKNKDYAMVMLPCTLTDKEEPTNPAGENATKIKLKDQAKQIADLQKSIEAIKKGA